MTFLDRLMEHRDTEYATFQSKLTPTVPVESFIGVRVPIVRKLAKSFLREPECEQFLAALPHTYYDENMLHAAIISLEKDYDRCIRLLDAFLPYVDNWAVCDIMSPKIFQKHKPELLEKIREWVRSDRTYTCRFGIEMLMSFYLDEDFRPEYLEIVSGVHREDYYVQMMVAWFFATALAKQWEDTIPYLEKNSLDVWCHNKTIQKACESYRITDEKKQYCRSLKRKE